jgi:hypothetical protein
MGFDSLWLSEVLTAPGVDDARAREHERTAVKGFEFEQVVLDALTHVVTQKEDVPEHVGAVAGTKGKTGDIVVHVSPASTPASEARYVVEVRTAPAQRALAGSISRSRTARPRPADGLLRPGERPIGEPFAWFDTRRRRARQTRDELPLRLACLWARWICLAASARRRDDRARVKGCSGWRTGT